MLTTIPKLVIRTVYKVIFLLRYILSKLLPIQYPCWELEVLVEAPEGRSPGSPASLEDLNQIIEYRLDLQGWTEVRSYKA